MAQSGNKRLNASSVPPRPPRLFFLPEITGSQSGDQSTYLSSYFKDNKREGGNETAWMPRNSSGGGADGLHESITMSAIRSRGGRGEFDSNRRSH